MKTYKNFSKEYIGSSDIASLTLRFPRSAKVLDFGEDGNYHAYIVTEDIEIPEHYSLVTIGQDWVKIYDDDSLVCSYASDNIEVYRSGMFGVIIKLV
jgi:hypothetical protein